MTALRNLITDIPGVRVGHAGDARLGSGVTAVVFDKRGGGRASTCAAAGRARARPRCSIRRRRSKASTPSCSPAAPPSGSMPPPASQAWLREQGRGFAVREARVPIVPGAILFDLLNGGNKDWGRYPPYRELGYDGGEMPRATTLRSAASAPGLAPPPSISRAASARLRRMTRDGLTVGALVAVNAAGSVTVGDGAHFWAAPFEQNKEFGGRGWPACIFGRRVTFRSKGAPGAEHDARGRGDRRQALQGAGQAARRDGADGAFARDLSGAHPARRRRGVRRRHGGEEAYPIRCSR